MNNGLFEYAIDEFMKATTYKESTVSGVNSYKAFYNAGVIRECQGNIEEAISFYKKCGDYEMAQSRLNIIMR